MMASDPHRLVKKLSLGDGVGKMRKSLSHEPLSCDIDSSDEDLTFSGGVRLDEGKHMLGKHKSLRKPASVSGVRDHIRSTGFFEFSLGSKKDDDVFSNHQVPVRDGSEATNSRVQTKDLNATIDDDDKLALVPVSSTLKVDAQVLYPPSACLFVANLAQQYGDTDLEAELTRLLDPYGTVFVKIRRDRNHMPFAFCQFTKTEHAITAATKTKGVEVLGRPCRIETANAHTSFIVYRKRGSAIKPQEAFELMAKLGNIEDVEQLDKETEKSLKIPSAMVVTYSMYDAKRNAAQYYARDPTFVVLDFDKRRPRDKKLPKIGQDNRRFLEQYDIDRRSAFFGGLPPIMTEKVLGEHAQKFGQVLNMKYITKHCSNTPDGLNRFAFIEFARPDSADDVIREYHDKIFDGYCIRVQRKRSENSSVSAQTLFPVAPTSQELSPVDSNLVSTTKQSSLKDYPRIPTQASLPEAWKAGHGNTHMDSDAWHASEAALLSQHKISARTITTNLESPLTPTTRQHYHPEMSCLANTPRRMDGDIVPVSAQSQGIWAQSVPTTASAMPWIGSASACGYPISHSFVPGQTSPTPTPGSIYGGYGMSPFYYANGLCHDMFGNLYMGQSMYATPCQDSRSPNTQCQEESSEGSYPKPGLRED